ncbi:lysozyme family protein [Allorhizobium taibaishanense]|uniref:Uncharacterized protein n=1 Tax=Allorhizobium taibaishanense TaxID=887144 RepID=A0A7W6HST2_9HYPH|nr:hypothetical protein [Allorhizobium taibaishanense]
MPPQVTYDATIGWQTGYFEGVAVFCAEDPGQAEITRPETAYRLKPGRSGALENHDDATEARPADPNNASIKIDLSDIGARP